MSEVEKLQRALHEVEDKYISAIRNILAINDDRQLTNPLFLDDLRKDFKDLTGKDFKAVGT